MAGPVRKKLMSPSGVTWLSVAINSTLGFSKIAAGLLFNSKAILADGFHTASDLVTDIAVLAGLGVSDKPPDSSHHYGHRRVATLVGLFVGAVLMLAGGWVGYEALITYNLAHETVRGFMPLILAVASVFIKEFLYQITRIVGQREMDISLMANAWHHRSDAFTSIAAAAGLTGVALGGPDWAFLDHVTALVLSAFLVVMAAQIMYTSASELIDRAPSAKMLSGIEQVLAGTRGVRSFHAVRARRLGGKVDMDVHIEVDPELSVREGHEIASTVRSRICLADSAVVEVIVHIEPARDQTDPSINDPAET